MIKAVLNPRARQRDL